MLEDSAPFVAAEERLKPVTGNAFAWIALACAAALIAFRSIAGWDVWWHLAIGREALATGTSVPVDTFSYSFAGAAYVAKDLIADIALFWTYDRFGLLGLALLRVVAILVALFGLRIAFGRRAGSRVWLVVSLMFLLSTQLRINVRPELFTIAAFPLMLGLIERARARIDRSDWATLFLALLPCIALQWVWLNLHRGGIIGLVLLLGFALALLLGRLLAVVPGVANVAGPRASWGQIGVTFAAFVIAVGVGLVNPNGAALYLSALEVTHDPIHRNFISEWQPLTLEVALGVQLAATVLLSTAWIALLGRLVAAVVSGGRRRAPSVDVWHLGLLALFTWQGVASMRWLPFACGAAAVVLGRVVAELVAEVARERGGALKPPRGAAALAALVGCLLIHQTNAHTFGLLIEPNRYPTSALQAARTMGLGPRVHNSFVYGGYVIWEGNGAWKTLIDGRNDMVYPSEFFLRCARAEHDLGAFAELWREHPADWVLADNTPGRESFGFLAGHPDWMLVYWSDEAVIYVLRDANAHLADEEHQIVNPIDPIGSVVAAIRAADGDEVALQPIRREIFRLLRESPDSIRANTLNAIYYYHLGPDQRTELLTILARLRQLGPDHPAVLQLHEMMGVSD